MSEMDPVLIILALIFGGGNVLAMLWGKRSDAVLPAPVCPKITVEPASGSP